MKKATLTLMAVTTVFKIGFAQFVAIPFSGNNSFRFTTPATVDRIGFGNSTVFPNGSSLPAIITTNSNGLTFPTGEQIRTNGASTLTNAWRMHVGAG